MSNLDPSLASEMNFTILPDTAPFPLGLDSSLDHYSEATGLRVWSSINGISGRGSDGSGFFVSNKTQGDSGVFFLGDSVDDLQQLAESF